MPELPEVEIAARQLRAGLSGRAVSVVWAAQGPPLRCPTDELIAFEGQSVLEVHRVGKQLAITFTGDVGLLLHLGMSGRIRSTGAGASMAFPLPHERLRLELVDSSHVSLHDVRRLGRVRVVRGGSVFETPEWRRLGQDALELTETPELFRERLCRDRRPIKVALLDQSLVAGIGNIYASEGLHRAGIHPRESTRKLQSGALCRLAVAVGEAMQATLTHEPGAEITYLSEHPKSTNPFLVYAREGQPCFACEATIERFVQAGRSTFMCPRCQPFGEESTEALRSWNQP